MRDFLLTLPVQYATYAADKKGMTNSAQIAGFVNQHMTAIRQRIREGADLEKDVFFADARNVYLGGATPTTPAERALSRVAPTATRSSPPPRASPSSPSP